MKITITDVAKHAGVSITTVSRVLGSSSHPVSKETRARILKAAEEIGYQPNRLARSLRQGKSQIVSIVLDRISGQFAPAIVRGIQDYLGLMGFSIMIIDTYQDLEKELEATQLAIDFQADGVIFLDTFVHPGSDQLPEISKPYVFINRRYKEQEENIITVIPDNQRGAYDAVKHLVELGHQRIGVINGPDGWEASVQRFTGYKEVINEFNLELDPTMIGVGDWNIESGYSVMNEFLSKEVRPKATRYLYMLHRQRDQPFLTFDICHDCLG